MPHLEPMLARMAERVPGGDEWAHEIKWDGVRAFLRLDRGDVEIESRRGEDATRRYPELAAIGERIPTAAP